MHRLISALVLGLACLASHAAGPTWDHDKDYVKYPGIWDDDLYPTPRPAPRSPEPWGSWSPRCELRWFESLHRFARACDADAMEARRARAVRAAAHRVASKK